MTDTGTTPAVPRSLKAFYRLMADTLPVRRRLVQAMLAGPEPVATADVEFLRLSLAALRGIPSENGQPVVALDQQRTITLDLRYEIGELEKDILYLEQGEEALLDFLGRLHQGFDETVTAGVEHLGGLRFNCLISDRDGTTNNYCGRYLSSVQSVYNAVFLSRFAQRLVRRPVFLTSAPLLEEGIVQISVNPPSTFIYAASKGRECLDLNGVRRGHPVPAEKEMKLEALSRELTGLTGQPEYEKFTLIGSGLQRKFGQLTIARQDIGGSVPEAESAAFLETVRGLVAMVDPEAEHFRIEDTGLDIEIILTLDTEHGLTKDFDKGDGVTYLDATLGLQLEQGAHLVCGDTNSDVPMLRTVLERCEDTWAVFVTRKPELADTVRALCPRAFIVPEPDMLVTILGSLRSSGAQRPTDMKRSGKLLRDAGRTGA